MDAHEYKDESMMLAAAVEVNGVWYYVDDYGPKPGSFICVRHGKYFTFTYDDFTMIL